MDNTTSIQMHEVTDPAELAQAAKQRAQFDRNSAWLQKHIAEVYARQRGKCICVAGEEVFAAETAREAIAQANAAHPEDEGWFTRYIPKDKVARIYALSVLGRDILDMFALIVDRQSDVIALIAGQLSSSITLLPATES